MPGVVARFDYDILFVSWYQILLTAFLLGPYTTYFRRDSPVSVREAWVERRRTAKQTR